MKIKLAYILLWIYSMGVGKTFAPYVEYALNKSYIAQVLCVNKGKPKLTCMGKCYLKKQLRQQQKEESKQMLSTNLEEYTGADQLFTFLPVHRIYLKEIQHASLYRVYLKTIPPARIFHPPWG